MMYGNRRFGDCKILKYDVKIESVRSLRKGGRQESTLKWDLFHWEKGAATKQMPFQMHVNIRWFWYYLLCQCNIILDTHGHKQMVKSTVLWMKWIVSVLLANRIHKLIHFYGVQLSDCRFDICTVKMELIWLKFFLSNGTGRRAFSRISCKKIIALTSFTYEIFAHTQIIRENNQIKWFLKRFLTGELQ